MPAAYFTTPAGESRLVVGARRGEYADDSSNVDVVKTRLQVEGRSGQTHYKGLTDAFVKICEILLPVCGIESSD